jgi:hypothetical protein
MAKHDGGKGDKQINPKDKDQFDKNWDDIFDKNQKTFPSELEVKIDIADGEKRVVVNKTWTF